MTRSKKPGPACFATESDIARRMIQDGLNEIDDPMITYLIGMLIDRVADISRSRREALAQTPSEKPSSRLGRSRKVARRTR
jgi:hypothetical protein